MTPAERHEPTGGTGVLVGAGQRVRRPDGGEAPQEAAVLMADALRVAAADASPTRASADALLAAVEEIWVPEGTWGYPDAGRVAARLAGAGADDAQAVHTVQVDVGVTQEELLAGAWRAVAAGRADVVAVLGGEARLHARAVAAGDAEPESTTPADRSPDERIVTHDLGIHDLEITRDIVTPAVAYALVEHARGHAAGRAPADHRRRLGLRWARASEVAAANPYAWEPVARTPDEILEVSAANRPIADPYPKRLCSQWNVDQAVALVLCSPAAARRFGIAEDRWVLPHASVVSNHAVPLVARPQLHDSPGARWVGGRAVALGATGDRLGPVDLYSCFPAAAAVLADAVGLPLDDPARPFTTTGGMAFGGGPLNSHVLHALAAMVPALRDDPSRLGLSTSVSGHLTKVGAGLWGARPPDTGPVVEHVTAAPAGSEPPRPVDADATGPAVVVSWTVTYEGLVPARGVVVADTEAGARTIAESRDPAVVAALAGDGEDWIGRTVAVEAGVLTDLG